MKGNVLRPKWPAPAADAASRPETARELRRDLNSHEEPQIDQTNRITLAVLEEFSVAKTKGYDPYNATAAKHRPVDVWKRKPRRD